MAPHHNDPAHCTIITSLPYLVGGWATPLKNISQLGWLFPIYGKIKNVPNHQPAILICSYLVCLDMFGLFLINFPNGCAVRCAVLDVFSLSSCCDTLRCCTAPAAKRELRWSTLTETAGFVGNRTKNMEVSKNWGHPQTSPIWMAFSIVNHPAMGVPLI